MKTKRIETIVDFVKKIETEVQVCDKGHMRIKSENELKCCERDKEYRG